MKEHIQLDTECVLGHPTKRPTLALKADTKCGWTTVAKARVVLCDFLGIDRKELSSDVHACHACNDERCINPLHLYFGSAYDNMQDIPTEIRQAAASSWERGVRFIAIDPQGVTYIADSFARFKELVPLSVSSFYKYAACETPVTQVKGQKPNRWKGWRFIKRVSQPVAA